MTSDQILDAIAASSQLKALVPNTHALAEALSVNRWKPSELEIGKGTVLETIGLAAGNAFLDVIDSVADFRHVRALVSEGRLIISSPLVQATIQAFVPSVLTQAQATALLNLGRLPDPVSEYDVRCAIYAADGKLRIYP